MARKKVKACSVCSWDDADAALAEIARLNDQIAQLNYQMNQTILDAKTTAEAAVRPLADRRKLLESDLKLYVTDRREEFQSGKSRRLNYGSVGFRRSTRVVIPTDAQADVIAWLEMRGMTDCITVKKTVNKDALKQRTYSDIEACGAQLKTTDEFWYDTEAETIQTT